MHAQKEQFVYDITSGEVPSVDAFRNLLVQGGISPTGNHVIVKRYVNENDSIGWHADKDGSFLPNYNIAVLTLGAERTIEFCQVEGGPVFSRTLAPGSLYVMPQELNRTWKETFCTREAGPQGSAALVGRALEAADLIQLCPCKQFFVFKNNPHCMVCIAAMAAGRAGECMVCKEPGAEIGRASCRERV